MNAGDDLMARAKSLAQQLLHDRVATTCPGCNTPDALDLAATEGHQDGRRFVVCEASCACGWTFRGNLPEIMVVLGEKGGNQ